MEFNRNNLMNASSPYLQQHKDGPIWWQEWSKEVHEFAQDNNKLFFISSGYGACHWCHVMAKEVFVDADIAQYLNEHFVSVNIDREQRPDIDQYLMSFSFAIHGGGGWPLNVFLTSDLRPIFAVTYVGVKSEQGIPPFIDILEKIVTFHKTNSASIADFIPPFPSASVVRQVDLIDQISTHYDAIYGGFGDTQKFPPYTTLLFLMHYFDYSLDQQALSIIEKTLDMMAMQGLQDHLQGGFFRYCIDKAWTIPHFEKLLYDQALMLWVYSLGYKILKKDAYKKVAENIIACLDQSFKGDDGLYIVGHSAGVNGQEGTSYVWHIDEIKKALTEKEFEQFVAVYEITQDGNFQGKNHLVKKSLSFLPELEKKLLAVRSQREQPFADKKIITSWNGMVGIAFIMAHRHLNLPNAFERAKNIFETLYRKHFVDKIMYHSSIDHKVQKHSFLQDNASMFVLATYLAEEIPSYAEHVQVLYQETKKFYEHGLWYETRESDFKALPAQLFDQPIPSSISLADYGIIRADILLGKVSTPGNYKTPLSYDFYNLVTFIKNGNMHIVDTIEKIEWDQLPLSAIQRIDAKKYKNCFEGSCKEYESKDQLLKDITKGK